jgi:hypothetical protein
MSDSYEAVCNDRFNLVRITPKYYDFVRNLRMNPKVTSSFREEANITEEDQKEYMKKHGKNYYVCLLQNVPIGYVGVVDDDIRMCVDPAFFGLGAGSFMFSFLKTNYPSCMTQLQYIKKHNTTSQHLLTKFGIPYTLI